MPKILLTCLLAFSALASDIPRIMWSVETSAPADRRLDLIYGETVDLQCRFTLYSRPMDIFGAAVVLHARTNGMDEASSFQLSGVASSNGLATVRVPVSSWMPSGLRSASYTLEVTQTNLARILRAKGTVWLSGTSAASTNAPIPVSFLSGYATTGSVSAVSSSLSYHVSRTDNPHGITPPQIGAATPAQINAATGAVLQSSLNALNQFAATNRVTRLVDSSDNNVWWEAHGGTNIDVWSVSVASRWILRDNNYTPHETTGLPNGEITAGNIGDGLTFSSVDGYAGGTIERAWPDELFNYIASRNGFFYMSNGSSGSGATMYCGDLDETMYLRLESFSLTNRLSSYMLTTGNVWQAVSAAQSSAADALLAADESWSALNNHLNISDPHPGKYAPASTTNAPEWIVYSNVTESVTLTNRSERPLYLYATGNVSVAFSGLRDPSPVYFVARGPSSLTFPAGTHFVGGGYWQTNMSNHFIVWRYGTNLFCNPVTTSED